MRFVAFFCVLFVVVLVVNADKELDNKNEIGDSNKFIGTTVSSRPAILKINKVCGLKIVGYTKKKCSKECLLKGYAKSSCKLFQKCTCSD